MLAGMSTDYYTRLERGNLTGVSQSVLTASPAHCTSTRPNARTCSTLPAPPTPPNQHPIRRAARPAASNRTSVRHGVQRILDTIHAPAYVRNGNMDILATNRLGRALFADAYGTGATFNLARYLFLDPPLAGLLPRMGDRRP